MQATHPLAFAGLIANTDGLDAPFRRLASTAKAMETVFFGTRSEADRVTERVRRMHARVRGELEKPAGRYPAGSAYDATSPELLLWILACIADSGLAVYERLVCRLTPDERDAYWADYVRLGELFDLDRADAPADYAEFRDYMDDRLRSEDLHVIEQAHAIAQRVAFELPLPASRAPALKVLNFLLLGLLPARVRDLYGLAWSMAHQAAYEALCRSLRTGARLSPAVVRRGPSAAAYELVARTERERLAKAAA
jgi:uncharacterized protein (DUF2236 family)